MRHLNYVRQIGYLFFTDSNSQAGRVYDANGLSPTIVCNGGGHKQPKVIVVMKRTDKIIVVGYVWNSRQNGMVLDIRGVSPCFTVGQHSGVEPKIRVVYESL